MLRIDSYTPIGKQIYIKHIPKNRAYILMDLGMQKVAIQTIPDTLEDSNRYVFEKKSGKKNFAGIRSEEHTSELQSRPHLVCRLLLEKKKNKSSTISNRISA